MKTIENINEITSVLTDVQKQILKDTINCGMWGDCDMSFLDEDGNVETDHCYGYCTNDAKLAGNHSGRAVSANFRAIYKKMCPCDTEIGEVISHFSDWWGDGSGDMLFIRDEYVDAFTEWAKQ